MLPALWVRLIFQALVEFHFGFHFGFNPLRKKWAKRCVNAQNYLRIFKLSKSVNGKESIPAQSTCHMASATEWGGREKASTSGFPTGTTRNGKQPNPFLQILKNTDSKTARRYAKLSANQRASIWIRQSRKEACRKIAGAEHAAGPSDIN